MPAAATVHMPRDGERLHFSVDAAVDEYLLLEVTEEQLADITQQQTAHWSAVHCRGRAIAALPRLVV